MEYVKFWIAKDLWEFSVVLTLFGVTVLVFFVKWVVDKIRAKRRRAAVEKWFERHSDRKE